MNFKGTPGPWHIGQGKNTGARTIIADDETWVGFAYGTRLGVGTIEAAEANAKLIAAAPDMLQALIDAKKHLEEYCFGDNQERTDVFNNIGKAIDKATS